MTNATSVFTLAFFGTIAAFAQSPVPLNPTPSRIVGHPLPETFTVNSNNPNLVEGRELAAPQSVALDLSLTPPAIYVSDTGNHRVLGWRNAASFRNGQVADLVIGQPDLYRTNPAGPSITGSSFSAGLNSPTGVAVYRGDLYVADGGNNRILRFRKPFDNVGNQFPDLYIGQPNLNSARANLGGSPDRQGLSLGTNSTSAITFDSSGNLWVVDVSNRRVLQFLASDVAAGGGPLRANTEIGQLDFTSVQPAVTNATRTKADAFAVPSAIAFDAAGRLYVSDTAYTTGDVPVVGRVLVFLPPFTNGMAAARMMGVFPTANAPSQDAVDKTLMFRTEGVFFLPDISKMGVVDSAQNRILLFDTFDRWPDSATTFSPLATTVIGQEDFRGRGRNRNSPAYTGVAGANTFFGPTAVAFSGTELFVVDTNNHRVLALPLSGNSFGAATRVLGQDTLNGQAINLIEGREFFFGGEAGIAIDTSGETPHLYVADPFNNRILGFNDMRKVQAGVKADLVIGQPDFTTGLCNFQGLNNPDSGNPDRPTQSSLCVPIGIAVDPNGDLYVADSINSRVLRFPTPFAHQGQLPQADLVLGQRNFTTKITDPSASTMAQPYGVGFATNNGLLVSDLVDNRVLYFPFSGGGTFNAQTDNGKAATKVFGQPDFFTITRSNATNGMSAPRHVSADAEARPYVADTGNNRLLIFDQINTLGNTGAPAAKIIGGFNAPRGLFVNQVTGEAWVGDSTTVVDKYPKFATLLINPAATGAVNAFAGLALAQDGYGNLAVADAYNRIAFHFPALQAVNGANFIPNGRLAPGVFASICSPGIACGLGVAEFGNDTADFNSLPNRLPYPKSLADVQVLVNGEQAPLTYVSPKQINFVVPKSAPTSGTAELQVIQPSTGRIYAAGTVGMNTYSPAVFAFGDARPDRQAAVTNQDFTVNSPSNRADRGTYITIYATGQGPVPNSPADGAPPQGLTTTPFQPRVFIGTCFIDECPLDTASGEQRPPNGGIYFSGLSPEFPGVWQINAYVPKTTAPGALVPILVTAGSNVSNDFAVTGYRTTIAVK